MPRRQRLTRDDAKARTREELIRAAAVVFGRKGFAAATLDEVAEEAGVTKGAVYSNFSNKEELLLAAIEENLNQRFTRISDVVSEGDPLEGQHAQAGDLFTTAVGERREWYLLWLEYCIYAARHPRSARAFLRRESELRRHMMSVIERRSQAAGIELPIPVDQLSLILFALGDGIEVQKLREPGAVPDDLFATAISLIYQGIIAQLDHGPSSN